MNHDPLLEKSYGEFELNTKLSSEKQEVENILVSILTILQEASVIVLSEKNNRFFANDDKANEGWKLFIETYLTVNPKYEDNETPHNFLHRHQLIFSEIERLQKQNVPDGQAVFELLYQLIDENWEKLFFIVFDRYIETEVKCKKKIQLLDVNDYKNNEGRTLAHGAVKRNNVAILKKLMEHKANLQSTACSYDHATNEILDHGGFTPLHEAAMYHSYECMEILIANGVNVNAITADFQQTALHIAAHGSFLNGIKLLMANGADLDMRDFQGKTPYSATENPYCKAYLREEMEKLKPTPNKAESLESKSILDIVLVSLNTSSAKRHNFFVTTAKENYFWESYIKEELTANPQLKEGESFYNFLKRHEKILLTFKDVIQKTRQQRQENSEQEKIFALLCEIVEANLEKLFPTVLHLQDTFYLNTRHAHINRRPKPLIHLIIAQDNNEMLNELIFYHERSLYMRAAGYFGLLGWGMECGNSPLQEAVFCGAHKCLRKLIKYVLFIDARTLDDYKESALHIAAKKGDIISADLLISEGATLDNEDADGNIPYQLAKKHKHEECAAFLEKKMQEKHIPIPEESSWVPKFLK